MRVQVDQPWRNEFARRIDLLGCLVARQVLPDLCDAAIADGNIGDRRKILGGINDPGARNQQIEAAWLGQTLLCESRPGKPR